MPGKYHDIFLLIGFFYPWNVFHLMASQDTTVYHSLAKESPLTKERPVTKECPLTKERPLMKEPHSQKSAYS